MSKKHYIKLAEILGNNDAGEKLVADLAKYFREDNASFKTGTFLLAVEEARHNKRMADEASFMVVN